MANRTRIYADTSVFGGMFDEEFQSVTRAFFAEVEAGKHIVLVSPITTRELRRSPVAVQEFLASLSPECLEMIQFTVEMAELRDAYLSARILGEKWGDDAAHVAAATVSRADLIISWNFRHLVKWEKIRRFNAVNLSVGYPMVTIHSPRELVSDERESI